MNYYYRALVKFFNRGLVRCYKKVLGSLIYSIVPWRSNGNFYNMFTESFGTRKAEVLNSLIINTTAKANDTTDILQTFR